VLEEALEMDHCQGVHHPLTRYNLSVDMVEEGEVVGAEEGHTMMIIMLEIHLQILAGVVAHNLLQLLHHKFLRLAPHQRI
jgi:hypothetical protein